MISSFASAETFFLNRTAMLLASAVAEAKVAKLPKVAKAAKAALVEANKLASEPASVSPFRGSAELAASRISLAQTCILSEINSHIENPNARFPKLIAALFVFRAAHH